MNKRVVASIKIISVSRSALQCHIQWTLSTSTQNLTEPFALHCTSRCLGLQHPCMYLVYHQKLIDCSSVTIAGIHIQFAKEFYCHGIAENNIDESYVWSCGGGETVRWEPNYDGYDDVIYFNTNNVVCSGKYFHGYRRHYVGDASPLDTLPECIVVPAPKRQLKKRELGEYIAAQIC